MKKTIVSLLLVFTLLFTACTPPNASQMITALNAVSDASSVAVVVTSGLVAMGKVSPEVAGQVSEYATAVSQAVTTSVTELNSKDSNPQKITVITAAFTKVAAPAIGSAAGTNAQAVSATVDAVSAAIKIFLNQLTSAGVMKMAAKAPTAKIELKGGDKAMLKQIQKKVVETQAAAAKLK